MGPILSHTRIVQMIKSYHSKYASLIKNYKRKMNDPRYKGNIQDFVNSSLALFDVCTCKCQDISKCACEKNRKVPKNEKFLLDQRSERLLAGLIKLKPSIFRKKQEKTNLSSTR